MKPRSRGGAVASAGARPVAGAGQQGEQPPDAAIWRYALPALIIIYLIVAGVHAYSTPRGATGYQDAPDEVAHAAYVSVVRSGRLPTQDRPSVDPAAAPGSYEWHQPPLYYLAASVFAPFGYPGLRLFSILVGLCGILVIYWGGRVMFPESRQSALLAAGMAALLPGRCAIMSTVSNDGLLELWFSLFVVASLVSLKYGLTPRRAVWIGMALGAALLTKATAVLLLPALGAVLCMVWSNADRKSQVIQSAGAALLAAAALCGWWFIRNATLYHEWLPLAAFSRAFEGTVQATSVASGHVIRGVDGWGAYALLVAQWTFQSFFAVYSTKEGAQWGVPVFLPVQLYVLMAAAAFASALGAVRFAAAEFRSAQSKWRAQGVALLILVIFLVAGSFVLFTSRYFQAQGRYFYPAMLPLTLLCAAGWRSIFPSRYVELASGLLLALLGVFCVVFLRTIL